MNVVGVVVLASPPRDPIRSKRHNGWRLQALHTYNAPTTPPSQSSEIWWSGRWVRQHNGMVFMVECMRRQGFACLRGGRRPKKRGFRNRAAAPRDLGQTYHQRPGPFIGACKISLNPNVQSTLCCPAARSLPR
jgi:hypothetical protein